MKFLTLFSALIIASVVVAQSDEKIAFETQFDLFSKQGVFSPNLKFRYFVNEANAIRATLNINYSDNLREIFEIDGEGVGSVQNTNSLTAFSLGYERHIIKDWISPYIGGEFLFGFGSNQTYGSRTDSSVFINDFNYQSTQSIGQFGVHLFTGVDIQLYKGLYCGTELGFRFLNTNYKRGEFKTEDASSTTDATITTNIPSKKIKSLNLVNMGVIRLGWKF